MGPSQHGAGIVTLEDVARIFAVDLPIMTDAQLARLLSDVHVSGTCPIGQVLAPLARAELLQRRNLMTGLAQEQGSPLS